MVQAGLVGVTWGSAQRIEQQAGGGWDRQGMGRGCWCGQGITGWAHPGLGAPGSRRHRSGVSRATVAIATPLRSYHRQEKSSFIINTDLPKLTLARPLAPAPLLAQAGAMGLMPGSRGWDLYGQSTGTTALPKGAFSHHPGRW